MKMNLNQILLNKARSNQLHNLYIVEPVDSESADECLSWAKNLVLQMISQQGQKSLENHPDVLVLGAPESQKKYQMPEIEEIFQFLHYGASEFSRKILLIENASALSVIHINKLLKTFEEPPVELTSFLINAGNAQLLPTLYSRAIKLKSPQSNQRAQNKIDIDLSKLNLVEFTEIVEKKQISIKELINYTYDKLITSKLNITQANNLQQSLAGLDQQMIYHNSLNTQLYTLHQCILQCGDSQAK